MPIPKGALIRIMIKDLWVIHKPYLNIVLFARYPFWISGLLFVFLLLQIEIQTTTCCGLSYFGLFPSTSINPYSKQHPKTQKIEKH